MIQRIGELCPCRGIGIRVNPGLGAGYSDAEKLVYAGRATTKFGIYREQWPDAVQMARRFGLKVTGLHFHVGCGYLTDQLPNWEKAVAAALRSEEHTSELQSLMRISYAVFCLKKKKKNSIT